MTVSLPSRETLLLSDSQRGLCTVQPWGKATNFPHPIFLSQIFNACCLAFTKAVVSLLRLIQEGIACRQMTHNTVVCTVCLQEDPDHAIQPPFGQILHKSVSEVRSVAVCTWENTVCVN